MVGTVYHISIWLVVSTPVKKIEKDESQLE